MALSVPQKIWLSAHPHRTAKWLRERIADGFDIHHIDADDSNNHPTNLILLETTDHTLTIHTLPGSRLDAVKAQRERQARIIAACEEAGMEYGAFVSKAIRGKRYWYWQDNKTRVQHYLGPDFPYMRIMIENYNAAKAEVLKRVA